MAVFSLFFNGCTTIKPEASIGKITAQDIQTILDVKLSHVELSNVPMTKALLTLSNSIRDSLAYKNMGFSWSIDVGSPSLHPPRFKDPNVSLSASNVTLREVLDEICRQSGWTYRPVRQGHWFSFQAPTL